MLNRRVASGLPSRSAILFIGALTTSEALAFGPSSDEIAKFRELMAVKWLSCEFEPIASDGGELLEFIGFDPVASRMRIQTAPPGETEFIEDSIDDEDSPFNKSMVLVFDRQKIRVRLVYPSRMNPSARRKPSRIMQKETLIHVQEVDWLTPGTVQFFSVIELEGVQTVFGMMLVPGKNKNGNYRALAHFSVFGFLVLMSAQCSEEIEPGLLTEIEKAHTQLESGAAEASAE